MTSAAPPNCPFVAGSMIDAPQFFVGRTEQLDFITSRMTGDQPTSINVVGPRRIGKSSLLYHFFQTYAERLPRYGKDPKNYAVIYLSLQDAQCQQETKFYQAVAQQLLNRPLVRNNPALTTPLTVNPLDRQTFSAAMDAWKAEKVLPVLCLDKIEALFQYSTEFNNGFYENLRALLDRNVLMIVVASYKRLDIYSRQHKLTSSFFNVGHVLPLTEITETEAIDLVRLPKNNVQGTVAALSPEKQKLAIEWGGRHPYLLQLAGRCLWEARQLDRDVEWARKQFDQQIGSVPGSRFDLPKLRRLLVALFWKLPLRLGGWVKNMGTFVNDITAWGIGIIMMVAIALAILGLIPGNQVSNQFRMFLCSTLSSALADKWCK